MNFYNKLVEIQQKGIAAALCTIVESHGSTPRKSGSKMIVYDNGDIEGTIGGGSLEFAVVKQAQKLIVTGQSELIDYALDKDVRMSCGGSTKVFIEPLVSQKKLYVFGAGHIGALLAAMAENYQFLVTLIDDRENFYKVPDGSNIDFVKSEFEAFCKTIQLDSNSYVCVATYEHDLDKMIIGYCAQQEPAYIGMIGSKGKIAKLKKALIESNTLTENQFDKINTPIGIGIECETSEEIVLSILAKIVDVRNRN